MLRKCYKMLKKYKNIKSIKLQAIITELYVYVAWCLPCVTPCIDCVLLS
jgi:hypothetical protein